VLLGQPDTSINHLSSFIAATKTCMWFSAVLPMGTSANASHNHSITCSHSITNDISNNTRIQNTGVVHGSSIVDCTITQGR
jgi:hypothetical protein